MGVVGDCVLRWYWVELVVVFGELVEYCGVDVGDLVVVVWVEVFGV